MNDHQPLDPANDAARRFAEHPPESWRRARAEADKHERAVIGSRAVRAQPVPGDETATRLQARPHRLSRWQLRGFIERSMPAGRWPGAGEQVDHDAPSAWSIWAVVVPCPNRGHPVLVWHAQQYGPWIVPEQPPSPRLEAAPEVLDRIRRWASGTRPWGPEQTALGVGELHPLGYTCPACGSLVDQWLLAAVREASKKKWTQVIPKRASR